MKSSLLVISALSLNAAAIAQPTNEQTQTQVYDRQIDCLIERGLGRTYDSLFCPVEDNLILSTIQTFGDRPPGRPGAVALLDAETIRLISADHPAEVLNTLPGVNIHTNSGQEHLIAIRSPVLTGGAGQGSFLILENGIPTRSPAFGNVNGLLEPHHETAEAIEVVRGPGSAKYGSNAIHGLINTILGSPSGTPLTQLNASYGSLVRYKGDVIYDQGDSFRTSASYQRDHGWRDNSDVLQLKGSALAELEVAGWKTTAWVSGSYLEQETADFIQGVDAFRNSEIARANDDPEAFRDAWSARGAVRLERELSGGRIAVTPFLRTQQMQFRQHFLPYRGFEKNGHHSIGVMSRYDQDITEALTWRIGADLDAATGYLRETQPEPFAFFPGDSRFPLGVHYDYGVDVLVGALWAEADWDLTDKLQLLGGIRAEAHHFDYTTDAPVGVNGRFFVPDDRTDKYDFVTPKLGLVYQVQPFMDLYANYARGSRAPQASDLYRLQARQGVAEARVETLDSLEIGARGGLPNGSLNFDLALYRADKENFFFRDSDGLNVTDGATRHQGIELSANWQVTPISSISGNISYADQTYTFDRIGENGDEIIRNGNKIDTAPEWLGHIALSLNPSDKVTLQLSADYVSEYFTNAANTQSYRGHVIGNIRAAYTVSSTLEGFVIIRNVTNEEYADRADFAFGSERFFPGEPVNVTIGLRKKL